MSRDILKYRSRPMWWVLAAGSMSGAALAVHSLSIGPLWLLAFFLLGASISREVLGYLALAARFVRWIFRRPLRRPVR